MENKTKIGLLLLIIGTIIGIIINIFYFILADFIMYFAFIGGIGGLIGFIGIIFMVLGRKEFGERHRRFVVYAIILFILAVILPTIGIAASIFAYVASSIASNNFDIMSNIAVWIIMAAILSGLSYVFLLYELEDRNGKIVLFSAFILTIIISIFVSINLINIFDETTENIIVQNMTTQEITEFTSTLNQEISKTGGYSFISSIFTLIALIIPYRRILSGELVPISSIEKNQFEASSKDEDRTCQNCGRIIPPQATTCPYCGKSVG